MSKSNQLAKLIVNHQSFQEAIDFTIHHYMEDAFHPDFVKEASWQMEGQYQQFLKITEDSIDQIYTPEEIDILIELHLKYPWMALKSEQLGQMLADKSYQMGKDTAEIVTQNLEETGDLERIIQEGFYIDEQLEG